MKKKTKRRNERRKPVIQPAPIDPNALYSPVEAAQAIRLSQRTFESLVKAQKLVPTWVGKRKRMFQGSGLLAYLQRQTSSTAPAA